MKLNIVHYPAVGTPRPTPLLLVHGAWHGAWCWENFVPFFTGLGYNVTTLDLRGHGESEGREKFRWHSAARGFVADLAQAVEAIGLPPVIIAHSMGGYVTQKYLETHSVPAAVLMSTVPSRGILGFLLRFMARHPVPMLKTFFTLNPWHMVASPALAHDAFFSPEVPAAEVERHYRRLGPESFLAVPEMALTALPKAERVKTPLLVLAAERDQVFSVPEQIATAKAYNTEAVLLADTAHDAMLEPTWQSTAQIIAGWLDERGF